VTRIDIGDGTLLVIETAEGSKPPSVRPSIRLSVRAVVRATLTTPAVEDGERRGVDLHRRGFAVPSVLSRRVLAEPARLGGIHRLV